jgi:hypothetical protein
MDNKHVLAAGKLYRGVAIFRTLEGCVIFGEDGKRFPFVSEKEAEAFIDAWKLATQRVMIVGEAPAQ